MSGVGENGCRGEGVSGVGSEYALGVELKSTSGINKSAFADSSIGENLSQPAKAGLSIPDVGFQPNAQRLLPPPPAAREKGRWNFWNWRRRKGW